MLFVGVYKIKKFVPSTELWWRHKIFFKIIFSVNEFSVGRKQEKPAAGSRFYFCAKIRKMTEDNCLHKSFSIFYQLQE